MQEKPDPLIWVGSELGSLKSFSFASGVVKNYTDFEDLDRSKAPSKIQWGDDGERTVLVGTKNGTVRTFVTENESFNDEICDCGDAPISGVTCYFDRIVSCNEKGDLTIFKENQKITEKAIGDHIQVMKQNPSCKNYIATGGKENNLKVYDLENLSKPIFAAKNVKNDMLDLRQPVWVTDIGFLKEGGKDSRIVTGTGDHKIKIYDPRKQRRPAMDVAWHEYPVTSISITNNDNFVIAGNTAGYMASIDLRTGQQVGSFKGIAGSIRSMQCHKTQNFVVSCGLDRFLRIYDIETRELMKKIYLKSKLNCVLLSDNMYKMDNLSFDSSRPADIKSSTNDAANIKDEESELIWGQMETTIDKKEKRSKKNEKDETGLKSKKKKSGK